MISFTLSRASFRRTTRARSARRRPQAEHLEVRRLLSVDSMAGMPTSDTMPTGSNGEVQLPSLPGSDPAVPIDGGWQEFSWFSPGSFDVEGAYTFTSSAATTLKVTDAFIDGDQFAVFDNGNLVGTTSTPANDGTQIGFDPDGAFNSPLYSHGSFGLAPGAHSITVETIAVADCCPEGAAFLRVDTSQLPFPTSLQRDSQFGGVDYSYTVPGGTLAQDVPVALYWSSTGQFDPAQATKVPGTDFTIPAGTPAGQYTQNVTGTLLKGAPRGTEYLLVVVGDPTSSAFDPTQDVQSLRLSLSVPNVYQNQGAWAVPYTSGMPIPPGWHTATVGGQPIISPLLGHSTSDTIASSGCYLTALDMALNNGGVATTPILLNQLLTSPPPTFNVFGAGYVGADSLNPGPATNLAAAVAGLSSQVTWIPNTTSDPQQLRDLLTSTGEPVIVSVTNPTSGGQHFVLVTGLSGNTFTINDPGYPSGTRTTLDFYGAFQARGYVRDPNADLSEFYFGANSASVGIVVAVVDSQNRVTGALPGALGITQQIPGSIYFKDGPVENLSGAPTGNSTSQFVYISEPTAGGYRIETGGVGAYTEVISGVTPGGQPTAATVFSGLAGATPTFTAIQYVGGNVLGPGVTLIGSDVYLVGGLVSNDQIQIDPIGTSNTGSTGVKVNAFQGGIRTVATYAQQINALHIFEYDGNDSVQFAPTLLVKAFVVAGNGNDHLVLAGGSNVLTIGNGNDHIIAANGNNVVTAGNGNDHVILGDGNNMVTLGNGNDLVVAGVGQDTVMLGGGNDRVLLGQVLSGVLDFGDL